MLAKHSNSFAPIDRVSVGVDRMQTNFEPMRKQFEAATAGSRLPQTIDRSELPFKHFLDGPPPGRNNAGIALGICGLPPGQARRFSKALSEGLTGDMDPRYGRCTLTLEIKIRHRIPTLIGNRLRFSGLAQSRSDRPLPLNKHPRQLLSPFDGQSMGGARRDYVQIQSQRSDSKQDPTGSSMRPLAMYQGTGLTIFNYAQR